mgnify:FL=1
MSIKERDIYLDALKGLGLLMMIFYHSLNAYSVLGKNKISVFLQMLSMPLFFICSGLLYKQKDFKTVVQRNFKKIIIPYLIAGVILWILMVFIKSQYDYGWAILLGSSPDVTGFSGKNYTVGPLWFLPAFFFAMIFSHFVFELKNERLRWLVIIIAFEFSLAVELFLNMPFGISQGIAGCMFVYCGYFCNKYPAVLNNKVVIGIGLVSFVLCFLYGRCAMSHHIYKLNLLHVPAAVFATFLSLKVLRKLPEISKLLSFLGKNSLIILCIHAIDRKMCFTTDLVTLCMNGSQYLQLLTDFILKLAFVFLFYIIYSLIKTAFVTIPKK